MKSGHSSRKHSDFSPSASKRWMTCPGSVRLARLAPAQIESVHAREGTEAHECLEFITRRFGDFEGATKAALQKWPMEMVGHATTAAEALFGELRPSPDAELKIETRVVVRTPGAGKGVLFGTLDYAWVDLWGTLGVHDYKYGAGVEVFPVDEDGKPNPQLMIYALGLAAKHHYDFEKVELGIIQPRTWNAEDGGIKRATVSIKALKDFGLEVVEAVKRASDPNAPLVSGEHCRWCPAAATCPQNSKDALEQAHIAFDIETGIQASPAPMTLDAATLPRVLKACDQLEEWIAAVRAHAFRLAEDGTKIPGYKLVAKRAQRVWLPDADKAAMKQFGIEAFDINPEFLSPAKLEKKFGKPAKAFTEKHTTAVSSGFTLAPESDKRGEIISTAVFDHE